MKPGPAADAAAGFKTRLTKTELIRFHLGEEFFITTDMARLRAELLAFALRRLSNPEDAEDLVQRVFLRALEGSKGNDRALLFHIARGLVVDEYRRLSREAPADQGRDYNLFEDRPFQGAEDRARILDPDGDWGTIQSPTYTIDDALFTAGFDSAVRGLDDDPRDAFILGELRGLPSREAGVYLGVSHETANSRRAAATAEIRRELVQ